MIEAPHQISLNQWDTRYGQLVAGDKEQPLYGGRLSRHVKEGDLRLKRLRFDNSQAALDLWNFLLSENDRLRSAKENGKKLVGVMKDLGTIPVMAYACPELVAFYPDGAWWIPCVMEGSDGLLDIADRFGMDDSFCPVRAMFGAFVDEKHFPLPDRIICSVGAVCDDFSAIAQRIQGIGQSIFWWEIPNRRHPDPQEISVELPGGFLAPGEQVEFVKGELARVADALAELSGHRLTQRMLTVAITRANEIRKCLSELRRLTFTAQICPLPALELLVAEMMAIHYCSDRDEVLGVLSRLLEVVQERVKAGTGFMDAGSVRVFWVNPVADLRVMNLLEDCGGRLCGTEYLFTHALDRIPTDIPPMDALARMALADPMVGSSSDRAARICRDIKQFGSEAVIVSKIPGASHCSMEGAVIAEKIRRELALPVIEIEVASVTDSARASLETRLSALMETVREQRKGT